MRQHIKLFKDISFFISLLVLALIMNLCCSTTLEALKISSIITALITIGFGIYLVKKNFLNRVFQKLNKRKMIMSIYFSLFFGYQVFKKVRLISQYGILSDILNEPFKIIMSILLIGISLFCVFCICYYILSILTSFMKQEIKKVTKEEKNFFIIGFLIMLVINTIWYSLISNNAIRDDILYSIDSYYVSFKMFPEVTWFLDFRHIFFSILTFPFYCIFATLRFILPLPTYTYCLFLAMIQVIFLLLTAIMLKRITKNKWMMYLYAFSFPTMLFGTILEKFQLSVFLIILFIYARLSEKEEKEIEDLSLICSAGAVTTSAILGIWSNREKGLNKIKGWLKVALLFIGISVVLGKWNILITVFDYAKTHGDLSFINRIYGVTELMASSIIAPLYQIRGDVFIWQNEANYLNILGLILLGLCTYSFIKNRKNKFAQICFSWLCFMLFFFLGMNWYCYEAPLFNLYFSWAILGLLWIGFHSILERYKYALPSILLFIIIINSMHLIQILKFLLRF